MRPLRLADGIIGKTCNFINQSGILLSIKGALLIIMPGQVQAGTILGKLAYTVWGEKKKKGVELEYLEKCPGHSTQ